MSAKVTIYKWIYFYLDALPVAKSSKPWREFGIFVQDVLNWKNTAESLVAFLVSQQPQWSSHNQVWSISSVVNLPRTFVAKNSIPISPGAHRAPDFTNFIESLISFCSHTYTHMCTNTRTHKCAHTHAHPDLHVLCMAWLDPSTAVQSCVVCTSYNSPNPII